MRKLNFTLKSTILCSFILTCASLAQAQGRTFVSGTGNDANACTSVTAPCRTFQRGHNAVAAGGEVVALTSAGYGSLSITKSVTISGEGIRAAITAAAGGHGVTIAAPGASVILRELTIEGNNSTGDDGVHVTDAGTLYIERCVITSFSGDGIDFFVDNLKNNRLFVTDTVVRSNALEGLNVFANPLGTARINVDRSRFERNRDGIGLQAGGTVEASITNSIMSENTINGFIMSASGTVRANVAYSTAANNTFDGFALFASGGSQLNIEYSVARGNRIGMVVFTAGDTIRVSNSVATNNDTGFFNGGIFESRINNTVRGNTNPNLGVITPLPAQ